MTTIEKLYPAIRGHRITTDSRQIIRGDIFIALKGENFDGNRYAAAALEQGAALAIIDNADYLSPDCELVADSLPATTGSLSQTTIAHSDSGYYGYQR